MTEKKITVSSFQQSRNLVARSTPAEAAAVVLRSSGKDAAALLFEHPEPEAVMALIPPENVYLLIKQLGEGDAVDVLDIATGEQVQTVFDFECWDKDRLLPEFGRRWFQVLMELTDDKFIGHLREFDFTFLVLFTKRHLSVERFDELIDWNPPKSTDMYMLPDRRHILHYIGKEDAVRLIHEFTQRIYKLDHDLFDRLLEAVYWEAIPSLEEDAYGLRTGRMADLAFPDYYSAIEIFSVVDPDRFVPMKKVRGPARSEEMFADVGREKYLTLYEREDSFLRRLLAKDFDGRDAVITEIMSIVNMATVAERVSVADVDKMRRIVRSTEAYINIGLEYLSGAVAGVAESLLSDRRLLDIYKVGRSLVHRLGVRARKLVPIAAADGVAVDFLMLESPHKEFVTALVPKEPMTLKEGRAEPFGDLREVESASLHLAQIERLVSILSADCGLTPETVRAVPLLGLNHDNADALTYGSLFATAFANDALGRPFHPTPLKIADVVRLFDIFSFEGGGCRLNDETAERFNSWLAARDALGLLPYFEEFFAVLSEEMAIAKKARRPDARYLSSLLVELPY